MFFSNKQRGIRYQNSQIQLPTAVGIPEEILFLAKKRRKKKYCGFQLQREPHFAVSNIFSS